MLALLCLAVGAVRLLDRAPAADRRHRARRSRDLPLLPRLLGGPDLRGHPAGGRGRPAGYINTVGDSVYYGDCVQSKGIFGGGSCLLPLQVTTVDLPAALERHPRRASATSSIRGVPATVYDEGRSIELYSGTVAIDIFSDTFPHALQAADQLRPMNAPGSAAGPTSLRRSTARALRAAERIAAARHGQPARPGLPARRRRGRLRQAADGVAARGDSAHAPGTGASGLPISRRRLRKASEPISAGTHSEIAR